MKIKVGCTYLIKDSRESKYLLFIKIIEQNKKDGLFCGVFIDEDRREALRAWDYNIFNINGFYLTDSKARVDESDQWNLVADVTNNYLLKFYPYIKDIK